MMSPMSSSLKSWKSLFADSVLFHVDLKALAALLQVGESGLAHVAKGHQPSSDRDADFGREFFGGFGAIGRENIGDGMGKFEAPAVGPVSQTFDFADAGEALLEQLVFQRQNSVSS